MKSIYILHGDEPQMIEDEKNRILNLHKDKELFLFTDESPVGDIVNTLMEESLFGGQKILVIKNTPLLDRKQKGRIVKRDEWNYLYTRLLEEEIPHPIIIEYTHSIDKKKNGLEDLFNKAEEHHFKKLSQEDTFDWLLKFAKQANHSFTRDAEFYMRDLLLLWDDVPLYFLQTEFERLFLFLNKGDQITRHFLEEELSDYSSIAIFKFTDAIFAKDTKTVLYLMPYVTAKKQLERFVRIVENELRNELIIQEAVYNHIPADQLAERYRQVGLRMSSKAINYRMRRPNKIPYYKLAKFLEDIYLFVLANRRGEARPEDFKNLCLLFAS